jgi:hypothetical protein
MLDSSVARADSPPPKRRIWAFVVVGVVVFALIAAGSAAVTYAHTYQPLTFGGTYGPATRNLPMTWDGISDTRFILVGAAGTTAVVDYSVRNNGPHPVRLLGLDPDEDPGVTGLKWSNLSADNPGGGAELGLISQARSFPVTLQPGESVFLQLALIKPRCQAGSESEITGLGLRWSAFGVHHVWWEDVTNPDSSLPVFLCPPKSALAHIDTR